MPRAIVLLLAPADALLRRLRLGAKLALIGLVLVAPALYAANAFRGQQDSQIGFSAKERTGVAYLAPAGALLDRVAIARATAVRAAAGSSAAQAALPAARSGLQAAIGRVDGADRTMGADLRTTAVWRRTRARIVAALRVQRSPRTAWDDAAASTLELIVAVGDGSNLILDPDLDSFYVMDALITKLPGLVDAAGRATALETSTERLTLDQRIAIAVQKGAAGGALSAARAGLATARKSTSDAALAPAVDGPEAALAAAAAPLDRALAAAAAGRANARSAQQAEDAVLARSATLRRVLVTRLDALLARRIDGLRAGRTRVLAVTAVGVLVAAWLFLAFLVALTGAVREMVRVADAIAEGDVEQRVDARGRDELSALAAAFQRMVAYLRAMVAGAERIARGDLSTAMRPASERDALGAAFSRMTDDLRGLVGELTSSAGRVGEASREMATTSEEAGNAVQEIARAIGEVAEGAGEQVDAVERTRATAETMAGSSQASSERAAQTRAAADDALVVAREGERALVAVDEAMAGARDAGDRATDTIGRLGSRSEQIGGITETVRTLAEQTNLLALNAAIEAARAGEHGRGFAVVAEEVRSLADETDRAGAQIAALVAELQAETHAAVDAVHEGATASADGAARVVAAREAFSAIQATVATVAAGVQEIAEALESVSRGAGEVQDDVHTVAGVAARASGAMQQVSASAQQTSGSTQQIAAAAQELARTAHELERLVGRFAL
jgi:methyl-accepting chemotaxis protein